MYDDDFDLSPQEVNDLMRRYEKSVEQNDTQQYFEFEEFLIIIDNYTLNRSYKLATNAIENAENFYPQTIEIKLRKANVLLAQNKANTALRLLTDVESLASGDADWFLLKSRALMMLKRTNSAVECAERALEQCGEEYKNEFLMMIAHIFADNGRLELSRKYLEKIDIDKTSEPAMIYDVAMAYIDIMEDEPAEKYLLKYIDEKPLDSNAWIELGNIYMRAENAEKALDAYDYALSIDDTVPETYFNRAEALAMLKKYKEAIESYKQSLQIDKSNLQAECAIGECYEKLEDYDSAIDAYQKVLDKDNDYANAHFGMAVVLALQGEYTEALEYVKHALEINSANSEYWFGLSKIFINQNHINEAIGALEEAIKIDPDDYESWIIYAELFADKDIDKTISLLEKAYAQNYDIPEICCHLAFWYFQKKDIDKCAYYFEKGMTLSESASDMFFELCPEARNNSQILNVYLNHKLKNYE